MSKLSIRINGDTWKSHLLSKKEFVGKFGKDVLGMTWYDHKKGMRDIYFRRDQFEMSTVIHEVTHAYLSRVPLEGLSYGQCEEKFCDLMGFRGRFILQVSKRIYDHFK